MSSPTQRIAHRGDPSRTIRPPLRRRSRAFRGVAASQKALRPERGARPGPAIKVGALLRHPSIAPIHGVAHSGLSERNLITRLTGGRVWTTLLQQPLTLEDHLSILVKVCEAIHHAHSCGIAHLDLKPDHVIVGPQGEVLVVGWGLAVDYRDGLDSNERHAPPRSAITATCGTPAYMPPELAEGQGERIGPWTDIYLLGGMLHQALTGDPPHRGEGVLQTMLGATLERPRLFEDHIPGELQKLCRDALEADPRKRPASARSFQHALERMICRPRPRDLGGRDLALLSIPEQQSRSASKAADRTGARSAAWLVGAALVISALLTLLLVGERASQLPQPSTYSKAARSARLISELGSKDRDAPYRAMLQLERMASGAVPALTEALRSSDPQRRRFSARTLGKIGAAAAPATPALVSALEDAAWPVRCAAAESLGRIGARPELTVPALGAAMTDPRWDVRIAAISALGALGPAAAPAAPALFATVASDEPSIKTRAVAALARIGAAAVAAVSPSLDDQDWKVRWRAINTLAAIGAPATEALPALKRAQADSNTIIQQAASRALERITQPAPVNPSSLSPRAWPRESVRRPEAGPFPVPLGNVR